MQLFFGKVIFHSEDTTYPHCQAASYKDADKENNLYVEVSGHSVPELVDTKIILLWFLRVNCYPLGMLVAHGA